MPKISNISDRIVKKILKNPVHARDLLKKVLPQKIKERLDFNSIEIDPTNFVSDEFQEGYSDIVVKVE